MRTDFSSCARSNYRSAKSFCISENNSNNFKHVLHAKFWWWTASIASFFIIKWSIEELFVYLLILVVLTGRFFYGVGLKFNYITFMFSKNYVFPSTTFLDGWLDYWKVTSVTQRAWGKYLNVRMLLYIFLMI